MEQVYDVFYEGLEHRIIIDRAKINPNEKPNYENGFLGTENLPFPVVVSVFRGTEYPGLKYEEIKVRIV